MEGLPVDLSVVLQKAIPVVLEAGAFIRDHRHKVQAVDIEVKGQNSLVSYVDKKAEEILVKGLSTLIPDAGFITEEATSNQSKKTWTWVIDPLDGTTNFLQNIPVFSVSVALLKDDQPVLGLVYEVVGDEMFTAIAGKGAHCNGSPIQVTEETNISDIVFATGFPYEKTNLTPAHFSTLQKVLSECRCVRRLGSAAIDLCYVASGRFGVYYETNLNSWDVAAGGLIVQEAGGIVKALKGKESWLSGQNILAYAPVIEKDVIRLTDDFRNEGYGEAFQR